MNYKEAVSYLEGLERFGIHLGLQNISFLLSCLGNPHKGLNTVLVAGTNGKGSVCSFLSNILMEEGMRIGLYTSPHLLSIRERMMVNGEPIDEERFTELVSSIRPYVDRCNKVLSHPTYFEVITAISFLYFKEEGVDLALLEVGLGGRLDATNVVRAPVDIITNIEFDHTDRLGNTLSEIAFEEAGIIKGGEKVITGEDKEEPLGVIKGICKEKGASIWQIDRDMRIDFHNATTEWQEFTLKGLCDLYPYLKIRLLGSYQIRNAALAVGAVELLGGVSKDGIKRGLERTRWPGRIEVLGRRPWIVLDGAHNPAAAKVLAKELIRIFPFRKILFVLGILKDKDFTGIVNALLTPFIGMEHSVIVTQPRTGRALPKERLAEEVARITKNFNVMEDLSSSIALALDLSGEEDLICVTGSLYTVADAKLALEGNEQTG